MSDGTKSAPPSEGDATALAHQINAAIASSHTKINRLILDRMPKAVPPQTDNPSTYVTGLLHIGAVYIAFESLWQNLIGVHSELAPIPYTFPFTNHPGRLDETPQITDRLRRVLEEAYWPNMLRAARIKSDVQAMTNWPGHVIDEQIRSVGTSGRLGKFTLHIRDAINAKPHLVLAYAYCLYLALLSGGSYIRTELLYLRVDFWRALPTPIKPNMVKCRLDKVKPRHRPQSPLQEDETRRSPRLAKNDASIDLPLDFLDFDPPLGDSPRQQTRALKAEFKTRFAEAEQLLAEPERKDIIKETAAVFHHLEGVVAQLDKLFSSTGGPATVPPQSKTPAQPAGDSSALRMGGAGFRLRDSIAIAKGRLLRTRRKSSGSSVTATVPTVADALSLTDSQVSESSKPSSRSEKDADEVAAEKAQYSQHDASKKEPEQPASILAHNAAVPADGFRTIRYDSQLPKPNRPTTPSHAAKTGTGGGHGLRDHSKTPRSFDGASEDIECCPMSRTTATRGPAKVEPPNYALYAVISNVIVLAGMAGLFVAYLYLREDGWQKAKLVEL